MKLTKRHKIYAVMIVVGGAIVIMDRITSQDGEGGPPAASAATSSALDDGPAAADADPTSARTPGAPASDLPWHGRLARESWPGRPCHLLADRLGALCKHRGLNALDVPDAFASALAWFPQAPTENTTVVQPPRSIHRRREFQATHRLTGVVVVPGGGRAIINGTCVAVGQKLDGFRLVSVAERSAVLVEGKSRVVLSLPTTPSPGP